MGRPGPHFEINMTVRYTCLAALLVLAACGSGGSGGTPDGGPDAGPGVTSDAGASRSNTIGALTGDANAGKTVYTANCVSCHKADGMGTPGSFPSLSNAAKTWTKPQFFAILLEGEGGMPSYAQLSDQQLANVTEYVRTTFNK
jgi:mono/diheme cytochrome c family protein